MLLVDPDKRATFKEVANHAWTRSAGPLWERPANVYMVHVDRDTGKGGRL